MPVQIQPDGGEYSFSLPLIRCLDIKFKAPVTFFVGENGTGKSILIEAIAALRKLPGPGATGPNWQAITVLIRQARSPSPFDHTCDSTSCPL